VKDLDLWLAFAAFHAGDYQRALDVSTYNIYFIVHLPLEE
jgi:hypothetical protein